MNNSLIDEFKRFNSNSALRITYTVLEIIPGFIINAFVGLLRFPTPDYVLLDLGTFITAGTSGPLPGVLCCLATSIINPYFYKTSSANLRTLLTEIAIIVMYGFISKGWMKSKPKAFLIAFINYAFMVCGDLLNFSLSNSNELIYSAPDAAATINILTSEGITQIIAIFLSFISLNNLPDRILIKIPNGVFYVRDETVRAYISDFKFKCRKKSIESHVNQSISLLFVLLTLSACLAFNILYFNDYSNGNDVFDIDDVFEYDSDDESEDSETDDDEAINTKKNKLHKAILKELPLVGWKDPDAASKNITFFIKFVSMLLSIEVAAIIICTIYLRNSLLSPIISVTSRASKCIPDDHNITEAIDDHPLRELNIKTGDEVEALYDSILKMIVGFNHYVRRMYHEQQLMNELEVEKKAGKAKSEFLSNMSHELRTPINAVIGLDEVILRESTDENTLILARDIQNAGKSLLGLINDILDFSKIEAGKMDIIPVNYDLSSVINDLVNMVKIRADKKNLDFIIDVDKDTPHLLYGDEIRLKQVITNILTNAVKYTEKGSVTLSISHRLLSEREVILHVSIRDTGIGMKKEDLGKLFNAFERIEEKRNRTIEGTGLGLNITQSLLTLMDSRLEVTSTYGEGSVFSFALKQTVLSDEPIGDLSQAHKKSISPSELYHESFTAPDAEILVVDDTEMNLTVVKGLLKQTLIKIDTAKSGFECLDMVRKKHYDLIFLDHRMPEMDGIETLEKLNNLEDNMCDGSPIIALTANALSGARERYIDAGFYDYLTKPIDYKKLEKMIVDYLPSGKVKPAESSGAGSDSSAIPDWLYNSDALNLNEGIKNCGSEDTFLEALRNFYDVIEDNSASIENFYSEKDWHNYNIKVHALKSSARLIGAENLSDMAFSLEAASEDDAVNTGYIKVHNSKLLKLYRSYKEKLSALDETQSEAEAAAEKTPISKEELAEAYSFILELIESVDYETAEEVIKSLEKYALSESESERYEKLKKAAAAFDWDSAAAILKE